MYIHSQTNIRLYSEAWLLLHIWDKYGKYKPIYKDTTSFIKAIAKKKVFVNPFRADDIKPSLQLYFWNNRIRFMDYGDAQFKGDLFDLVGFAIGKSGKGSFGIICDLLKEIIKDHPVEERVTKLKEIELFEINKKDVVTWNVGQMELRPVDIAYFGRYGIKEQTLLDNNVKGVRHIVHNGKLIYDSQLIEINSDPLIQYEYTPTNWQIYRPQSVKNIKWINWVGDFILNTCELDSKFKCTLITKSTKDGMLLKQIANEIGIKNIAITNVITETQQLSNETMKLLLTYNHKIALLFDNDLVGKRRSTELQQQFGEGFPDQLYSFSTKFVEGEKDITDYCLARGYDETKRWAEALFTEILSE